MRVAAITRVITTITEVVTTIIGMVATIMDVVTPIRAPLKNELPGAPGHGIGVT